MELIHVNRENIGIVRNVALGEQNGVMVCQRGHMTLSIDEHRLDVDKDCMVILPGCSLFQVIDFTDDVEALLGVVDFDFVLTAFDEVADGSSIVYLRFHPLVKLDEGQRLRIEEMVDLVERRLHSTTALSAHVTEALIQALCYEVLDGFYTSFGKQATRQSRKDVVFQQFLLSLHRHYHEHRDVNFYAGEQCLTTKYFSTLVHDVSGRTPSDWIVMFVTLEAKRLLGSSKMSVKEIADRLHFPTQSFFCRYFKQYAGSTPLEYREGKGRLLSEIR